MLICFDLARAHARTRVCVCMVVRARMFVCLYLCVCVCVCVVVCARMFVCLYLRVYACVCVCARLCLLVWRASVCVYMSVCECLFMCVCVFVCLSLCLFLKPLVQLSLLYLFDCAWEVDLINKTKVEMFLSLSLLPGRLEKRVIPHAVLCIVGANGTVSTIYRFELLLTMAR